MSHSAPKEQAKPLGAERHELALADAQVSLLNDAWTVAPYLGDLRKNQPR
jgi:hypothetical protein